VAPLSFERPLRQNTHVILCGSKRVACHRKLYDLTFNSSFWSAQSQINCNTQIFRSVIFDRKWLGISHAYHRVGQHSASSFERSGSRAVSPPSPPPPHHPHLLATTSHSPPPHWLSTSATMRSCAATSRRRLNESGTLPGFWVESTY